MTERETGKQNIRSMKHLTRKTDRLKWRKYNIYKKYNTYLIQLQTKTKTKYEKERTYFVLCFA